MKTHFGMAPALSTFEQTKSVSGCRRVVAASRAKIPVGSGENRCRKGVQEQFIEIEPMAVLGLIRAIHAIGIELTRTNPLNPDMPHITRAVACGIEINHLGCRCVFGLIKQLQPNAAGVSAEEREVDSFATGIGSQRQWHPHANISPLRYLCHILMQRAFRRLSYAGVRIAFAGLA